MASDIYTWYDFYRDMMELRAWYVEKPKWWQFRKYLKWKKQDPRKNWR